MGYAIRIPPLFLFLCGALLLLPSCWKEEAPAWGLVSGKRPVYLPESSLLDIRNLPPQDITNSGTIFLRDTLFFMLENGRGIHVFSVQDPARTYPVTFFKIPAISDFTIAGYRLYADSWRDLLTLDISDILAIRVLQRQPGYSSLRCSLQPTRDCSSAWTFPGARWSDGRMRRWITPAVVPFNKLHPVP
jgi:hypothetical protein